MMRKRITKRDRPARGGLYEQADAMSEAAQVVSKRTAAAAERRRARYAREVAETIARHLLTTVSGRPADEIIPRIRGENETIDWTYNAAVSSLSALLLRTPGFDHPKARKS